jgi:hypothetical protein
MDAERSNCQASIYSLDGNGLGEILGCRHNLLSHNEMTSVNNLFDRNSIGTRRL